MDPEPSVGRWRRAAAGALAALLLAYLIAVVSGLIHENQRLNLSDLAVVVIVMLAIAVVVQPRILAVFPTLIRVGNVEVQLQQLQRQQRAQRQELEDIRLALELLLTDPERQILRELDAGNGSVHNGSEERRVQLRRLAGMHLVSRREGKRIAELADGERTDLAELVELTDRGRSYLVRIAEGGDADG